MTITARNLSFMSTEQKLELCKQKAIEKKIEEFENCSLVVLNREYLPQFICDQVAALKDAEAINPRDLSPRDVDLLTIILCNDEPYELDKNSPEPIIALIEKDLGFNLAFDKVENTQFIVDMNNSKLKTKLIHIN